MISKFKTNSKNNNNKDDNIDTNINIDIDYTNNNNNNNIINTIIVIMMIIIIKIVLSFSNNNNNNNIIDDSYNQLSKCIKVTVEELFNGEDSIKRRKSWFEFSQKSILEKIKERNDVFGKYSKEKSISNLTILRNSKSNLKKRKKETKICFITSRVAELENMNVDPRTS